MRMGICSPNDGGSQALGKTKEMDTIDFVKELKKAENIYDVLVIFYGIVDNEHSPQYLQNYDHISEDRSWKDINRLLDSLLQNDIEFRMFLGRIVEFLDCETNIILYALHIITYFDQVFLEKEEYAYLGFGNRIGLSPLYELGPLNTMQDKYLLYLSPVDSLLKESKAMKSSGYRLISFRDGSDILERIKSYYIVPVSGCIPRAVIKGYTKDVFCKREGSGKTIKMACIPLCKKNWFHVKYMDNDSGHNYFKIVNDPDQTKLNNNYIRLFEHLIEEKAEIVVLPELSMNEQTEREIRKYLSLKSLQMKAFPLKLIFLGSLWKDGRNECVLLSGSGSVLCRNLKRNPFELKKDGKRYKEALVERPTQYELMDVPHLGRILYSICKDAFDEMSQVAFHTAYAVDFEVISSFSASLSYFDGQMRDLAEKHLGVGIVANACSPRVGLGEKEIGFIEIPYMRKKSPFRLEGMKIVYQTDDCCEEACTFAGCMHIFDLKPDEILADGEKCGITVDYTRRILK